MASDAPAGAAKLYVILGSHACRSAILMLDHKGMTYETIELPAGTHPMAVRALGFNPEGASRKVQGRTPPMLAMVDRLGTVPALRVGGERVMTNHRIARLLERLRPQPPLFPADPERRARVEEIEHWADEVLQMVARRAGLAGGASKHLQAEGAEGRLGPLLFKNDRVRNLATRMFGATTFAATPQAEQGVLAEIPAMLDSIDGWIAEGLIDGEELNAADFMIAPSLALLEYHDDLREDIRARPAGRMLERVMPLAGGPAAPAPATAA